MHNLFFMRVPDLYRWKREDVNSEVRVDGSRRDAEVLSQSAMPECQASTGGEMD